MSELISAAPYPLKPHIQDSFPKKKYLFRLPTGSTSLRIGYLTISPQNLKMIPRDHCMVGLSDISVIIKETFHYAESQRNILSEEHFCLKSIYKITLPVGYL